MHEGTPILSNERKSVNQTEDLKNIIKNAGDVNNWEDAVESQVQDNSEEEIRHRLMESKDEKLLNEDELEAYRFTNMKEGNSG